MNFFKSDQIIGHYSRQLNKYFNMAKNSIDVSGLLSKSLKVGVTPIDNSLSASDQYQLDKCLLKTVANILAGSVREVRPCLQERIICAKGQVIMEQWRKSREHQARFGKTLDSMIISYQDKCAPDQLHDMLTFMPSVEAKCECLAHLIKKRHTSLQDDMFRGSVLLRDYCDAFGVDALDVNADAGV